jgi:uncharacterized protein (UPF0332 family)
MTGAEPAIEAQTWQMALGFLLEAENGSSDATPRMVTHAAYYAMYHAARAALIQVDGLKAPTKHSTVVGRFGQLAKQAGITELMAAGRLINEMQEERLLSDYAAGRRPSATDAAAAVEDARRFLAACASHYRFQLPKAP